jgi:DNA-binding NarL/FixJ family response regulator
LSVSRVLVVETGSLLGAGVQNLLSRRSTLEVVGLVPKSEAELLQVIRQFRPRVIVLDETTSMIRLPSLMDHLRDYPQVRVVAVNAEHAYAQILEKSQVSTSRVTDFLMFIEYGYHGSEMLEKT